MNEEEKTGEVGAPQEQPQSVESQQVEMFKTSTIEQPETLKKFLQEKMTYKYNKYCIDCKKNQTTHFLVWCGSFVCKQCAEEHVQSFGGNQNTYAKDVYGEHWDDYCLKSMCLGGNEPLFELMREYGLENEQVISKKYNSAAARWYKRKHMADMDGLQFDVAKPPKDWNERMEGVKTGLASAGTMIGSNLSIFAGQAKVTGGAAAVVVGQKASTLKEKISEKAYGQKLMAMFGKKPAADEEPKPEGL